jgi:hypothetical protein
VRELDREANRLELQEKKVIADIKKSAKAGQMVVSRQFLDLFIYFRTQSVLWRKTWSEPDSTERSLL